MPGDLSETTSWWLFLAGLMLAAHVFGLHVSDLVLPPSLPHPWLELSRAESVGV